MLSGDSMHIATPNINNYINVHNYKRWLATFRSGEAYGALMGSRYYTRRVAPYAELYHPFGIIRIVRL